MMFEDKMTPPCNSYRISINQKNKNIISCLNNCSKVEIFDKDKKYLSTFEYTSYRPTDFFSGFISISDDFFVFSNSNVSSIVDFMGNLICTIDYYAFRRSPDLENLIILSDGTIITQSRSYEHNSFLMELLFFKPHY